MHQDRIVILRRRTRRVQLQLKLYTNKMVKNKTVSTKSNQQNTGEHLLRGRVGWFQHCRVRRRARHAAGIRANTRGQWAARTRNAATRLRHRASIRRSRHFEGHISLRKITARGKWLKRVTKRFFFGVFPYSWIPILMHGRAPYERYSTCGAGKRVCESFLVFPIADS